MKKYIIILPIVMLAIPHTITCSSKKQSRHDGTKAGLLGILCGASAYDTLLKMGTKHSFTGEDYGIESDDEDASTRYEPAIRNLDQYQSTPEQKRTIAKNIIKLVNQKKLTYSEDILAPIIKIAGEYSLVTMSLYDTKTKQTTTETIWMTPEEQQAYWLKLLNPQTNFNSISSTDYPTLQEPSKEPYKKKRNKKQL